MKCGYTYHYQINLYAVYFMFIYDMRLVSSKWRPADIILLFQGTRRRLLFLCLVVVAVTVVSAADSPREFSALCRHPPRLHDELNVWDTGV